MKQWMVLVGVALMLVGCGEPKPQFQTQYEFISPPTPQSRFCATTCLSTNQTCKQNCTVLQGQCRISNDQETERRYQDYVNERQRLGRELKKDRTDFDYYGYSCDSEHRSCNAQCESNYRQCYTSCGGKVVEHTNCVDNCHLIGQGSR